ncbi:hypothetical protein Glov_2972 [Trichlorobacter lovleyi SZ]|uniref:Uncharacterized protein n=1 Tax=Trichlorobacter lovleyi (strain ATCC BAA-1151 / DSM 17278 / SZ) TaxID=398767 RepID=B3E8K3_TRIL1|nr:hypothetical protein Glov_2972 [Trichlorobacter lovleyi SZ]
MGMFHSRIIGTLHVLKFSRKYVLCNMPDRALAKFVHGVILRGENVKGPRWFAGL